MRGSVLGRWQALGAAVVLGAALAGPAAAQSGAVLKYGNGSDVQTLDPHQQSATTDVAITTAICEGLVAINPKGAVVPGLAESWTVAPDGLTYTFKLRAGLKWSDGTPFKAEAFVWSWRRHLNPATRPALPDLMFPVMNAEAVFTGKMNPESLGILAPDDRTVVVKLERPAPDFLGQVVDERFSVPLQREAVEKFGAEFVRPGNFHCTGAYKLAEVAPQSHIRVVKNPHYWDAANVAVETIDFMSISDSNAEMTRFRSGELHVTNTVPVNQMDWARQNLPDQLRVHLAASTYTYMPNLTREPWKSNVKLRTALALAVDREALVTRVTRGGERPAYTLVPPGIEDYDLPIPEWASWTQEQRNARARELLVEAGYGPGKPLSIEILYNTLESHRMVAIAVGAMWKQNLGIDVTLNNQEWKVVLDRMSQRSFPDLIRRTWIADFPQDHLVLLRTDGQPRVALGWSDPNFDRIMNEAGTIADRKAYRAKLREAEAYALPFMPTIPIMHATFRRLVSPKLKGFEMNITDQHNPKYFRLEN